MYNTLMIEMVFEFCIPACSFEQKITIKCPLASIDTDEDKPYKYPWWKQNTQYEVE